MKLALAAPASGFPFLSTAFGSQPSVVHFVMKLLSAPPVSAFPSLPTALLCQVSCATADPTVNVDYAITRASFFMTDLLLQVVLGARVETDIAW
jgi:hypothetical protein